jgi:16S rRNA (guanine527-N7)-methyltransferase
MDMALTALGSGWHERIGQVLGGRFATPLRVQQLARYLDLLVSWNAKLDLTAARDADELCDLILADAVVIADVHLGAPKGRWVDVGSGAGAPGLPLALLLDESDFTLVEPLQKRVSFLRTAIGTLGCDHVRIERRRSDALPDQGFDVAVSRATLPPDEWVREGARLARESFWLLLAKADPPAHSLPVEVDRTYTWPLTHASRRALRLGART